MTTLLILSEPFDVTIHLIWVVPFSSLFDSIFNSGLAEIKLLKILKKFILAFDDSIATDFENG